MASREVMDSGPSDHVFSINSLPDLLNKLWNARSKWYNIGLGLGLSADELDSINQKGREPGDCLREVLIEWLKKRTPRKSQLIEALKQPSVGYEQLADDLRTWVPPANATQNDDLMVSSASESMTFEGAANTITGSSDQREKVLVELSDGELQNLEYRLKKDVTEIHEKFATLQTQIRESLSNKGVCAKKVAAHVIAYGIVQQTSDEKLKFLKHDGLEEVFSILSDHWSFLDYDLLKSIVKNYGNEHEKSIIEKYQKQLELFCERRVSEVPKGFIQNKSEHDLHDEVIIKLNRDHPRLKHIEDLKPKVCNVMGIEPATLQIIDVRHGCVEVIFLVSRHISYVFERPLTKQQWEAFQSASIVYLSYRALQLIFVKPNFEAVITYIEKELECNDELLDKLVNAEQKEFTPSGRDFLVKVRESGWIAPDNLTPLYDLLERVNRHDIVHKAKLEGLVHGDFAEFEEQEKDGQSKELVLETKAAKLKKKGIKDQDIIKEYIKELKEKKDDYFEQLELSKGESSNSESDDDEDIDSDYQSDIRSMIDSQDENPITMGRELEHQYHDIVSESDVDVSIDDSLSFSQESQNPNPASTLIEDQEWKVECTSQVLKKLRHKKTPVYLRKAVCKAISDLARKRHCIPVKLKDTEHQLYQRKIFQKGITIFWESSIQFSPDLTKSANENYYTDVIRLWDIAIHERSCQNRIKAIKKAWNREKEAKVVSKKLKLCNPKSDQSPANQCRIFKCVVSDSESFDFQIVPPIDPDPNQYKPAILYTVPRNIELLVSTNQRFELPMKVWPEEHKIINMPLDSTEPIIVLGRSGTGKTTCCLYRMVQEFLNHYEYSEHPLRQLFVTRNKSLCEKVEKHFMKLIASQSLDVYKDLVQNLDKGDRNNLKHSSCPLFLTLDDFLPRMEYSLCDSSTLDDNSSCESARASQVCLSAIGTKITADFFINQIWKHLQVKDAAKLDPELVWMEIKSFIKGSTPSGDLSLEEYVNLSPKIAPNYPDPASRKNVYEIYTRYKRLYKTMILKESDKKQIYDECDLVFQLYHKLLNDNYSDEWLFDGLYVDEVQDFTQCEVLLLIQSCKPTSRLFLTGDTAQTVMRDVSFRFKDMKTSFFKEIMPKAPQIHELTINYRSHSGVLNLAKCVLKILEKNYPHAIDRVPSDNGMFPGPTPKFIKPCDSDFLKLMIAANMRDPVSENSVLGFHQAVIVRTESSKKESPFNEDENLVYTIYEAKGLEYDDVLLYNFFSGCPKAKEIWKEALLDLQRFTTKSSHSMLLTAELKHLYTAITRAKANLWIYESKPFDEHSLPILRMWREETNDAPLIDIVDPNSPNFKFEKSFATAKVSTPKGWKSQGDFLLKNKRWKHAAMCYRKVNRFDLEAEALLANPNLSRQQYHEIVIAYLQADEVAHNPVHLIKVAKNLYSAAKHPDEFLDVAWVYRSLKKESEAIKAYIAGGWYMKASNLYEECEKYPEAVEVLIDGKLYLDAVTKAKKFEDRDAYKSFELSSSRIAKKYILRYCQPPEKISKREDKMFSGLLPYIKGNECQILFLKHAKRFSEALDRLHHSRNYAQYYRLAFAQGSNVLQKKSPAPNALNFSDTYYDEALHLSLMQGLDDIHNALIVHSARAYFSIQKPYIILKLTQLENLSRTCRDSLIQINVALLLARFDSSKINEAVEICRQYECLPGEVELVTYYLRNKSLPINFSFHDQLEIAHKIQYLLSLKRDVLLSQYKGVLGLHKEKDDDKLYPKQQDYPEELKRNFEPGCYLLSHESQDIWLQHPHRLSQGKGILHDIDGMFILSPDTVFYKITGHLKTRLRLVEASLAACVSQSPLYKHHFNQRKYRFSGAHFDTEAAHFHLEFCISVLLKKLKFNKDIAMELLRCYQSIETSHCFPVCENYFSNIGIIRGGAWRTFQSLTTVWMQKCISNRDKFDFLKLWEQSAVTKLVPTLQEILECNEDESDVQKVALQKVTISWLDICQNVLDNPLSTCRSFFFECVPQLIKLKQNLSSIVDAMSIYGTITLMLISSLSSTSDSMIIIPHMYDRALSVYESLLSNHHKKTISSVCYNVKRSSTQLKDAIKVLQQAIRQLLSCLTRRQKNGPSPDNLREYLILTLTLFVNTIMLQPTSLAVSKFHLQLNKGLEQILKRKWKFQFDYATVYASIQQATSTLDLLKIIEYLLCPSSSQRYEALMTVMRGRRGLKMNILSDREVRALPTVSFIGLESVLPIPELPMLSSRLVPESERKEKLYFQFHFQDEKYSSKEIVSDTYHLPWMKVPESPDSETLELPTGAGSLCHICNVEFHNKDEHMKSDDHVKKLAIYRQFSMLHDTKYIHCASKLSQFMPRLSKEAKEVIQHILNNNDKMIQSIHSECQWESGIDLLLTYCIPNVENTLESLTHFPAMNLVIIARKSTQTTVSEAQ